MSTWSDAPARGGVLRGGAATQARSARLDSDLRSTPFASPHAVDARLTDPHLQAVVDRAALAAAERGHAQGLAAGYAEGQAAARADAARAEEVRAEQAAAERTALHAQVDAALTVLADTARALAEREQVGVAEVEDVVVDLALDLAQAVLARELHSCADPGREALARALALAPAGAPCVVARLHPQDLARLSDVTDLQSGRDLQLVADPEVEPGGCVVDTAGRRIDAQVGPALARAAAVLQ